MGFRARTLASAQATSTTNFDAVDVSEVREFRAQLDVASATPSGATLDIALEDSLDGTNFYGIASFTQVGASPGTTEALSVATPFGGRLRARAVLGGAVADDFTFSVLLHGKR